MKKSALILALTLLPVLSQAYILPTRTILQKTVENAGSGVYAIEQDVEFPNGPESLHVKESWLIENDHTLRLTVSGPKELQGGFHLQYLYVGGQRYQMNEGSRRSERTPDDFLERFFNFRTVEAFATALVHFNIIPSHAIAKKTLPKEAADIKYTPESWVRYSRTEGAVTFAFGEPSNPTQEKQNPGLWIDQDLFVLRKLRLPSQVEVTADNYNQFARNLSYPRIRTVRWGSNSAVIHLISASSRTASSAATAFSTNALEINQKLDGLNNQPAKEAVLEFYSRFR